MRGLGKGDSRMHDDAEPGDTSRGDWERTISRWAAKEASRPPRGGRTLPHDPGGASDRQRDGERIRDLYHSANGDHWFLALDPGSGRPFVRHKANVPSGGQVTDLGIEAFLAAGQGPEQQALLLLIATLTTDQAPG